MTSAQIRSCFHLHVLLFFLLGDSYCPSFVVVQSPALGKQFVHFEMELRVVTKLRQHGFTKAFLNSNVLSTPYSQETPLPCFASM